MQKIASTQHGLITRTQLNQLFSKMQIERLISSQILLRRQRCVYAIVGSSHTWVQDVHAAVLAIPGSAAGHLTASRLLEITPFSNEWIDVSVADNRHYKLPHVRTYRTDTMPSPFRLHENIPVVPVATTLLHLGNVLTPHQLARALDTSLHKGLVTLSSARRELERIGKRGRRGSAAFRELLDYYAPEDNAQMTALERKLLRALRNAGLPKPVREHQVVVDHRERFLDYAYPDLKIGIEAHSREWHLRLTKFEKDWDRDNALKEVGWTVFHITSSLLEKGVTRVAQTYEQRFSGELRRDMPA